MNSRNETADHGRSRDGRDDLGPRRGQRTQDTNLDTQRTQVGEPAKRVGGNGISAMRELVVAFHDVLEGQVGDEFVFDEFRGEQFGDAEDLMSGDTDEEGDGVEDVSEDELEGECVDAETFTDPGEETVDGSDEGDDGQHVGPMESEVDQNVGKRMVLES